MEPGGNFGVSPVMTMKSLRRSALFAVPLILAGCGSLTGGPAVPPTPQPKPGPATPAPLSQSDAEMTCLVQASRKFGVPFAEVQARETKPVDAGYRVKMDAGGTARTCIVAKDGFIRSLR